MDKKTYFDILTETIEEKNHLINSLIDENTELRKEKKKLKKKCKKIEDSKGWQLSCTARELKNKIKSGDKEKNCKENTGCYEDDIDFSGESTDIKAIAMYLPALHGDVYNDKWRGEGFTEWDNVRKGCSLFNGHNQPRVPHEDIGYYDPDDVDVLKKQIEVAKKHGIYGFGIYYYWFSGETVPGNPLGIIMEHDEIEFPFMLVWANEKQRKDKKDKTDDALDVLTEQIFDADEPQKFMRNIAQVLKDSRYIKIENKPVIAIHNPESVINLGKTVEIWRKTAEEEGIEELFVMGRYSAKKPEQSGYERIFDGSYEFPPMDKRPRGRENIKKNYSIDYLRMMNEDRKASSHGTGTFPVMKGITLDWDNSPVMKEKALICRNFSKEAFYLWNCINIAALRRFNKPEHRLLFVNAWNDWGEGAYLEPDKKTGYANLNALSKALYGIPMNTNMDTDIKLTGMGLGYECREKLYRYFEKSDVKIAVQAHVFYQDLLPQIIQTTNNIPFEFDLFVTTPKEDKKEFIEEYINAYSNSNEFFIEVTENKGRDVIPFIKQMHENYDRYEFVCHLHTKKSKHNAPVGEIWRNYLFENLLGSGSIIEEILYSFISDSRTGMVFPKAIDFVKNHMGWDENYEIAVETLRKTGINDYSLPDGELIFPAGDMFWAKTEAVNNIFRGYPAYDVPDERGQLDGTVMHAIERLWAYVADANGFESIQVRSLLDNRPLNM